MNKYFVLNKYSVQALSIIFGMAFLLFACTDGSKDKLDGEELMEQALNGTSETDYSRRQESYVNKEGQDGPNKWLKKIESLPAGVSNAEFAEKYKAEAYAYFDAYTAEPIVQSDSSYIAKGLAYLAQKLVKLGFYQEVVAMEPEFTSLQERGYLDPKVSSHFYLANAYAHFYLGNKQAAVRSSVRAAQEASLSRDTASLAGATASLALTYGMTGNHEKVLEYYSDAGQLFKEIHDERGLFSVVNNMAIVYGNMGKRNLAQLHVDSAVTLASRLGNPVDSLLLMRAYSTKGELYNSLKIIDSVEYYCKKVMNPTFRAYSSWQTDVEACLMLGESYQKTEKQDSAQKYLRLAIDLARKKQMPILLWRASAALIDTYEAQGDYYNGLQTAKNYRLMHDTILAVTKVREDAAFIKRFELNQKELALKEALLSNQEKELELAKSQRFVIVLIMVLLSFGVGLFVVSRLTLRLRQSSKIIEKQNHSLMALNRTKDKIFSLIAHDLRNPIGSMRYYPEMIRESITLGNTTTAQDLLDTLEESTNSVHNLMETLLQWSLSQQENIVMHPTHINCNQILRQLSELAMPSLRSKEINLEILPTSHELQAFADEQALYTVLRNLLFNAIKFTSTKGKITLVAKQVGTNVLFEVADTGKGIPGDKLSKILEGKSTFSTTGTAGEKGTGLGLSLVADLVKANNGELKGRSILGHGTTFMVIIPMVKLKAEEEIFH